MTLPDDWAGIDRNHLQLLTRLFNMQYYLRQDLSPDTFEEVMQVAEQALARIDGGDEPQLRTMSLLVDMQPFLKRLMTEEGFAEVNAIAADYSERWLDELAELPPPEPNREVDPAPAPQPTPPTKAFYRVVTQIGMWVREQPTTRSTRVGSEAPGTLVEMATPVEVVDATGYRWIKRADGRWMALQPLGGATFMLRES